MTTLLGYPHSRGARRKTHMALTAMAKGGVIVEPAAPLADAPRDERPVRETEPLAVSIAERLVALD